MVQGFVTKSAAPARIPATASVDRAPGRDQDDRERRERRPGSSAGAGGPPRRVVAREKFMSIRTRSHAAFPEGDRGLGRRRGGMATRAPPASGGAQATRGRRDRRPRSGWRPRLCRPRFALRRRRDSSIPHHSSRSASAGESRSAMRAGMSAQSAVRENMTARRGREARRRRRRRRSPAGPRGAGSGRAARAAGATPNAVRTRTSPTIRRTILPRPSSPSRASGRSPASAASRSARRRP